MRSREALYQASVQQEPTVRRASPGNPSGSRRRTLAPLVGLAAGLAALVSTSRADALPGLTLSASLRALYGAPLGDPEPNAYGAGVGLRAGITLPASLYLGASLDYFVGDSETVRGSETSASLLQVLGNVGIDFGLGPLTIRPNLGLGLAQANVEVDEASTSEGNFVLSPGAEVLFGLGLLSISGELRYNHIFVDGDPNAVIVGVGLGLTL